MKKDFLKQARIASPCSVGWETMTGNERTRLCDQCGLHVYNISAMTEKEVASLVSSTEGRICARLYRRADGTVLIRDCPVGLRAVRRRVSKVAGAVLTALLGLCSGAFGQSKSQEGKARPQKDKTCTATVPEGVAIKRKKTLDKSEQRTMSGVVKDVSGGIITGARITLINEETEEKLKTVTTDEGAFKFSDLAAGQYSLEIEAAGFAKHRVTHLAINSDEVVEANANLDAKGAVTVVGIFVVEPEIEHSNGTTIIRGDLLQRLPLP